MCVASGHYLFGGLISYASQLICEPLCLKKIDVNGARATAVLMPLSLSISPSSSSSALAGARKTSRRSFRRATRFTTKRFLCVRRTAHYSTDHPLPTHPSHLQPPLHSWLWPHRQPHRHPQAHPLQPASEGEPMPLLLLLPACTVRDNLLVWQTHALLFMPSVQVLHPHELAQHWIFLRSLLRFPKPHKTLNSCRTH
jgi:hypothetical protein